MWIICLILTIIFEVLFGLFYKLATDKSRDEKTLTFLLQTVCAFSILVIVPFFKVKFPSDIKVWLLYGVVIIIYAVSDHLQTVVRKNLEASVSSIIGQMHNVFMIIWGLVFFSEPFAINKIIGGVIILICNALLFYEHGKFKLTKYVFLGILLNLFWSTAMALDVGIADYFNIPLYLAVGFLIPAILTIVFTNVRTKAIKKEFREGNKLAIIITGSCWGLSSLFAILTYNLSGSVITVAPLISVSVLLSVIVSFVFLKEKNNIMRKIIASIGIILSIILITMA